MGMPAMAEKVVDISAVKASCQRCSLRQLCLPQELDNKDVEKLDTLIKRHDPLQSGEYLFRQADQYKSLYVVRSGSFKTQHLHRNGTESILGFHLPGEIMGLTGLGRGEYHTSAIALERATACELPLERLPELAKLLPSLNQQLYKLMSHRISEDQELILVHHRRAQERVASFILSLSQRLKRRGFSETNLILSMTRYDIANFLGLRLETVSRTLARLEKEGVLNIDRRNIQILDKNRIYKLSSAGRDEVPNTTVTRKRKTR